jgi:hypothetical protein
MPVFDSHIRDRIRGFVSFQSWSFFPAWGKTWYGWWFWWLCFHVHVTTKEYILKAKQDN